MRTWLCRGLLLISIIAFFLSYKDNPDYIYLSAAISIINVCICLPKGD